MKLELKIFDLSDEKTFFKKLKEMTKFHGATVGKIKTTNIFITKKSRQEYNQQPCQDIKVINLKEKDFQIDKIKEIIKINKNPILINSKSGKWAFYESTDYLEQIYTGEQAKNQENPYVRMVCGKE